MNICLILKEGKKHNKKVINFFKKYKKVKLDIFLSKIGKKIPDKLKKKKYDFIISYLSAWVLDQNVLNNTKYLNINFHPGPPKYPGIGCFNFAIFNNEKTYGATMHEMKKKVDSGKIIKKIKFNINKLNLIQLIERTYEKMFKLLKKEMPKILAKKKLNFSKNKWSRKAYTRKDFNNFCKIDLKMKPDQLIRKIKAISHPDYPDPIIDLIRKNIELKSLND